MILPPPERGRLRLREIAIHALLLLALIAIIFPGVFLRGEIATSADLLYEAAPWKHHQPPGYDGPQNPVMSDFVTAFVPFYAMVQESLAASEWPLWNPREMAGMPLLANYQSTVFYPPRLLHSIFDLHQATTLFILLKLWLCGMTAYLCARGLGLSIFGARFASFAWMLCGYNQVWAFWPLPDVSAWTPVLFFGVECALRGAHRRAVLAIGAGGCLLLLAGHPETAFAQALGCGIYFFLRLLLDRAGWGACRRAIGACAVGWGVALALSAAQWVPFVEYLLHSHTFAHRGHTEFHDWIPTQGVAALFVPRFFGTHTDGNFWGEATLNRQAIYPGMLVWACAFIALAHARPGLERRRVGALGLTAALCMIWAFDTPSFNAPFSLPGLNTLRINYMSGFAIYAVGLMAAFGLEWHLRSATPARALLAPAVGAVLALVVVVTVLWFNEDFLRLLGTWPYVTRQVFIALAIAVAVAMLLLLSRRIHAPGRWATIAVAVLAADLLWAYRGMNPTLPRAEVFPDTPLTTYLQELPQPARVQAGTGYIASGLLATYGIEEWLGYDGLYPARVLHFMTELGPDVWNSAEPLCAITWYLNNPKAPTEFPLELPGRFEKTADLDGIEVYRNTTALPRAFLVPAITEMPSTEALFARMRDDDFDPRLEVLTEAPPVNATIVQGGKGVQGTVAVLRHSFTQVVVRVQTQTATALVLADAFYPGWKATIGGKATAIFPAYHAFRGVIVPKGDNEVTFTYAPASFAWGMGTSSAAALVALALGMHQLGLLRRPTRRGA